MNSRGWRWVLAWGYRGNSAFLVLRTPLVNTRPLVDFSGREHLGQVAMSRYALGMETDWKGILDWIWNMPRFGCFALVGILFVIGCVVANKKPKGDGDS